MFFAKNDILIYRSKNLRAIFDPTLRIIQRFSGSLSSFRQGKEELERTEMRRQVRRIESVGDGSSIVHFGKGNWVLLDDEDLSIIENRTLSICNDYVYVTAKGETGKLLHRVIMNAPKGLEVDHVNSEPKDNRKANLRLCTRKENMRSRRKHIDNKSGWKGVTIVPGCKFKFKAQIGINGKVRWLGNFETGEEAHAAYKQAALKNFGKYAHDGINSLAHLAI